MRPLLATMTPAAAASARVWGHCTAAKDVAAMVIVCARRDYLCIRHQRWLRGIHARQRAPAGRRLTGPRPALRQVAASPGFPYLSRPHPWTRSSATIPVIGSGGKTAWRPVTSSAELSM